MRTSRYTCCTEPGGTGQPVGEAPLRRLPAAFRCCELRAFPAGLYNAAMSQRVVRRILVPVDLSGRTPPDADYAIRLAAQLGAELVLFAVVDTPAMVSLIGHHRAVGGGDRGSFSREVVDDAKAILQTIVDDATRRGVRALGHVTVSEEVEEQILKEALVQRADLVLVRQPGHGGFMKALLGSTAGDILKAAPCPVLVARG